MHHRRPLYRHLLPVLLFTFLFTLFPTYTDTTVKADQIGPQLLKDFNTHAQSLSPSGLFPFGDKLLFYPAYSGSDMEPWVTDGTKAGTRQLKNILAGGSSLTSFYVSSNGWAYFAATSEAEGNELWRTDGTPEHTTLVADINPGGGSSSPQKGVVLNGILYFAAYSKSDDARLSVWSSDGTAAGTKPFTGPQLKTGDMVVFGSSVYFFLIQDTKIVELWRTKPDGSGVERVKEICGDGCEWAAPFFPSFTVVSNQLFFSVKAGLWRSDGSTAGTVLVKQFSLNESPPLELTAAGNLLYFTQGDFLGTRKVWHSDGSLEGTAKVLEVSGGLPYTNADNLIKVGSILYFTAYDTVQGSELWKVEDVNAPAQLVKIIMPGVLYTSIYSKAAVGDVLFFTIIYGSVGGDLWRSQGTAETTQMVNGIAPGPLAANVFSIREWNGKAVFAASDELHGRNLWISDGSNAGTNILFEMTLGTESSQFRGGTPFQGKLYFAEESTESGSGLWRTDGTPAGTEPVYLGVKPLSIDAYSSTKKKTKVPAELNQVLYFSGNDPVHGTQLWRTDGTNAGTYMVKEIVTGFWHYEMSDPVSADGFIWFTVYDGNLNQLWRSDGTESGTVKLQASFYQPDIAVLDGHGIIKASNNLLRTTSTGVVFDGPFTTEFAADGGRMGDFLSVNGRLFFTNGYNNPSALLFVTNGQTVSKITQMGTGAPLVGSHDLTLLGNSLYFSAKVGAGKKGLWQLNPDSNEASLIKEFDLINGPDLLVEQNGQITFRVTDSTGVGKLWVTDGTSAGTRLVCPACTFSVTRFAIGWQGWVYFTASDRVHGKEVWQTNGTASGTELVRDVNPANGTALPGYFYADEKMLVFAANDGEHGIEPWSYLRTFNNTLYLPAIQH